jgi:hypothetical protein
MKSTMYQVVSLSAALLMWCELKKHFGQGGFLLFDKDGNGGAWYSDNAQPDMEADDIPQPCCRSSDDLGTLTEFVERTQNWLDARAEEAEQAAADRDAERGSAIVVGKEGGVRNRARAEMLRARDLAAEEIDGALRNIN